MEDYPSDSDQIQEEQVEYTYLDGEYAPLEEFEVEENENQNFGIIDVEAYERVMEQTIELNNRTWELKYKCQDYEKELRIMKRSVTQKVKDKLHHWKRVAANFSRKTKKWVKRLRGKPVEGDALHRAPPRYRDLLAERYYPRDMYME